MHEENHKNIEEKKLTGGGLTLPKAIIIAGILIAIAILFPHFQAKKDQALSDASEKIIANGGGSIELLYDVDDEDFITGSTSPKITIVEFSDFGCSFCSIFHPTLQAIVEKYPNDVAWVYRHLPYRNTQAALASECVGQTFGDEAFWNYTNTLFSNYPNITRGLLEQEAVALGFANTQDFWECQGSEKVAKAVERDKSEATLIGANGTPHSLIITQEGKVFPVRGASSFEQMSQMIELLLK